MATEGKLWIILNPEAGKGSAAQCRPKIERFLREKGRSFEMLVTQKGGDALDFARDLPLGKNDAAIAAGGDGTCNEVANGLLRRQDSPGEPPIFGVLPIGRGNDFSSTPGIPQDIDKALDVLIAGKLQMLDVGMIKGGFFPEGRYFVNGVGIGFDTKVGFEAAKLKMKSGLAYVIGALITLIRYEPSPLLQIRYGDNEMTFPAAIVSVVNGKRMGGSFYMGPNAVLDDGLLDICSVRHQPSRFQLLKRVYRYTKGTQGECEGVYTDKASHFHLKALEGSMVAHCDGETVCYDGKELEITCLPGALRLIGV